MRHINLDSYNNFETFNDQNEIVKYRENKYNSLYNHIKFIKNEFNSPIKVTELGSGNCKLLIRLVKETIATHCIGYDISESRNKFAKSWVNDSNTDNEVFPRVGDITKIKYNKDGNRDLFLGLDIIWHFMEPTRKGSSKTQLKEIYNSLNNGGKIIFEFCDLNRYINTKTWEEFKKPDPWCFSLWDCWVNNETNYFHWDKKFIGRDNNMVDEKNIILEILPVDDIEKLIKNIGFTKIKFYDDWDGSVYTGNPFEYIVVAEK
tara:strand:+ start:174 stop:956 length:783 start_codon:yes stop_codon:yes gene_type:complete